MVSTCPGGGSGDGGGSGWGEGGGTQENISYVLVIQLSVLGLCIRVGGRGYQADMGLLLNLLTHQFTGQLL